MLCKPEIMYKVVDLPQPEGPKRPTNLPSGIVISKSLTATVSRMCFLRSPGKTFVRFLTLISIFCSFYIGYLVSSIVLFIVDGIEF